MAGNVPRQWKKGHFSGDLKIDEGQIEKMRKFAEQWLIAEMPGKNLRGRKEQTNAKAYANGEFRSAFAEVFDSMSPSPLANEAPYGFVKWVHEAMTARGKGDQGVKRESTERTISPAVISPAYHSTSGQPQPSTPVIEWVYVVAFDPSGRCSSQIRLSMDSMSRDGPLSVVPALVAVRYLSFDRMNESIRRFGLLDAEKIVYVPREDTSFQDSQRRRLITNDVVLQEAVRVMLTSPSRQLEIWIADGKVSSYSLIFLYRLY